MIVDLANVSGSAKYKFSVPGDDIDLETPGVQLMGDVRVTCEVTRHIIETVVTGTVETAAEIDCTRCLKPVSQELDIPFEVSFVAPDAFPTAEEVKLNESDLGVDVFQGEQIDLKEVTREQILLNLPDQVICSEDCKGLCERCGTNLNMGECSCDEDDIDPRWAALQGLKK